MPIDERVCSGGRSSTPPEMKTPPGRGKSPLIPATVACAERSRWIWVNGSAPPPTVPRASAGASW